MVAVTVTVVLVDTTGAVNKPAAESFLQSLSK